jgi:uncharacterized protein YjiS (DUF1127 family)
MINSQLLIGDAMTQYTEHCSSNFATNAIALDRGFRHTVAHWIAEQRLKLALRRERRQLVQLSDRQLRDIGIDREAAIVEAGRTDIPTNRLA